MHARVCKLHAYNIYSFMSANIMFIMHALFSWCTHHAGNYNAHQNIIILKYIVQNIIRRDRSRSTLRYLFVDAACLSMLLFLAGSWFRFCSIFIRLFAAGCGFVKRPPYWGHAVASNLWMPLFDTIFPTLHKYRFCEG